MLVKSITKKVIAIALIFTLTFANFALVSKTYAAGIFAKIFNDMGTTGSKNVEFDAYFKNGDEKIQNLEADVNSEDLKLYFDLSLLDEGYIKNSKVSIIKAEESKELNFEVGEGFENEIVEAFENNEFNLIKIEEIATKTIEVPINYKSEAFIDLEKLSEDFKIVFEGIYVNEEAEEIRLAKEITLNISWKDNKEVMLESEVTKFFQYQSDEENYSILQTLVKIDTTTENKVLPVKGIETKIELPEIEQGEITNIAVVARSTEATNNKSNEEVKFDDSNISFDAENNVLTIKTENELQKIEEQTEDILKEEEITEEEKFFSGTGTDEYLITYKIKNLEVSEELNLTSKITTSITTYSGVENDEEEKIEKEIEAVYTVSEQTGENVSFEMENETENISKGYIYLNYNNEESKYEIEYKSKSILNISTPELIEELKIEDNENYYILKDENKLNEEDTYYKSISILEENFDKILGENGKVEIIDLEGNVLATIDKTLEVVDGYLKINLEQKVSKISIRVSAPIDEGNLVINQTRGQITTSLDKQTYSQISTIEQTKNVSVKYKEIEELANIGTATAKTKLDDTTTKANLILDKEALSTIVDNKDVELKIELNNQKLESDIYGNSVFEIEFPEQIKFVEVTNISMLYGEGLELANAEQFEINGKIYVRITLAGKQKALSSGIVTNGTNIVLNADIKVDQYAPAKEEEIKLYYNNEEATSYTVELVENSQGDLSAVGTKTIEYSAPTGIVSVNSISNYYGEKTITSIKQGVKKDKIEILTNSKNAKMELVVMNNSEEAISNISILGRIPFIGVKDVISNEDLGTTVDSKLLTKIISEENNETNFKVYYSENGGATKDLNDENNGWVENPENIDGMKSYLIVPEDANYIMEANKIMKFSYEYLIPENLEHNVNICSSFATYYSETIDGEIGEEEVSGADIVFLTTGEGPQLKIETRTNIDTVKEFEEFTIISKVTNTAAITAEDVEIRIPIPNGTKYMRYDTFENDNVIAKAKENSGIFEIEKLEPGKEVEVSIVVQVQDLILEPEKDKIEAYSTVSANDLAKVIESEKTNIQVQEGELKVSINQEASFEIFSTNNNEIILTEGKQINLKLEVSNLKNEELKNVNAKFILSRYFEFISATTSVATEKGFEIVEVEGYDKENNIFNWNIDSIPANSFKILTITVKFKKLEDGLTKQQINLNCTAKADGTEEYSAPEKYIILGTAALEIKQITEIPDGSYIKENSEIIYTFEIKNVGTVIANNVILTDKLPNELTPIRLEYESGGSLISQNVSKNKENEVSLTKSISVGETLIVNVIAIANNIGQNEEISVTNSGTVIADNATEVTSNKVLHIVEALPLVDEHGNIIQDTNNNNNSDNNTTIEKTYKITGMAWLDENENGSREASEKKLSGITAKLVEAETGIIKGRTTTNTNGEYTFSGIANGNYIVIFDYDTNLYTVTKYQKEGVATNINSDVTTTTISQDGKQTVGAVTNTIIISNGSASNIDIGLVSADTFDLKLEKTVTKITVQNSKGTETKTYNNLSLAKTEIASKYLNGSTVYIEYSIKVSNVGELAGYAKKVVDYIPIETSFNSSLKGNEAWYTGTDGNLYSASLADTEIQPGQTREIKLILTKQMSEDSSSLITNTAEIYETYNVYGAKDVNSTAGNKIQNENDMSTADAIVGVKTGEVFIYTSVIITTLLLGGVTVFVAYNKLIIRKRKEGV